MEGLARKARELRHHDATSIEHATESLHLDLRAIGTVLRNGLQIRSEIHGGAARSLAIKVLFVSCSVLAEMLHYPRSHLTGGEVDLGLAVGSQPRNASTQGVEHAVPITGLLAQHQGGGVRAFTLGEFLLLGSWGLLPVRLDHDLRLSGLCSDLQLGSLQRRDGVGAKRPLLQLAVAGEGPNSPQGHLTAVIDDRNRQSIPVRSRISRGLEEEGLRLADPFTRGNRNILECGLESLRSLEEAEVQGGIP